MRVPEAAVAAVTAAVFVAVVGVRTGTTRWASAAEVLKGSALAVAGGAVCTEADLPVGGDPGALRPCDTARLPDAQVGKCIYG